MSLYVLLGIAVGLSMDALAVAVACSLMLREVRLRQVFRLSFHFGLFQAMMPIIGWIIGQGAPATSSTTTIGSRRLLASLAARPLRGLFGGDGRKTARSTRAFAYHFRWRPARRLAVGLSLAMIGVRLNPPGDHRICLRGITTVGMLLGTKLGGSFGRKMEIVGGFVLIGIGLKILLSHIL